ncbi:hypothetical protein EPUL_002542 [Erysiphe pulchra]|uniref:Protein phosphatase n=1 Tax=Erysiphe pulchra TaxID=225359 RepID=A0A2S4PZ34_9PEZI|nr:hypothetical protein EPUL_002542 [Erysiphe pulchra]
MTHLATFQWIARHYLRLSIGRASLHAAARSPSTELKATNSNFNPSGTHSLPFKFETGTALFAKKNPRPFPPPFISPPSKSFSDPLSTYDQSRDKRGSIDGEVLRGITNGDDAVYVGRYFIAANDGVGAWSSRPGGHSGLVKLKLTVSKKLLIFYSLWARLILHFWALEMESDLAEPDPIKYLQNAYEKTILATSKPNHCKGTTTVTGAQLYYKFSCRNPGGSATPLLYVTNLGDSQVIVLRPKNSKLIFKTTQQWHWFDCPRQLGTNSPDTPHENASLDIVEIEEDDVVLAVSDGVIDNLWDHEIVENVVNSIKNWESQNYVQSKTRDNDRASGLMKYVAEELMKAAKAIATDPYAESPFMEHAINEGLAMEGGR